jgi:hypothetical protein
MNTRNIASEYRLNYWAQIMQDCQASGMSISQYCKTAGFHPNKYYYWQRKLREASYQELTEQTQKENTNDKQNVIPAGWAICTNKTEDKDVPEKVLTIEINGCHILVEKETDIELLKKVCGVLITI